MSLKDVLSVLNLVQLNNTFFGLNPVRCNEMGQKHEGRYRVCSLQSTHTQN